jgi:protein-tyrosine phosphatase
MSKIVFVCSGNTCRSPMAEGIFNALSKQKGAGHFSLSCGLSAMHGMPASYNAVAAAAEYGADISGHLSRPVTSVSLNTCKPPGSFTARPMKY